MQERAETNCVGFVFQAHNLTREERYVEPPTWKTIQKLFTRVKDASEADILAIVSFVEPRPVVIHMATINTDKKTVTHRRGVNEPVEVEGLEETITHFLYNDLDTRVEVFFKAKPPKRRFWRSGIFNK